MRLSLTTVCATKYRYSHDSYYNSQYHSTAYHTTVESYAYCTTKYTTVCNYSATLYAGVTCSNNRCKQRFIAIAFYCDVMHAWTHYSGHRWRGSPLWWIRPRHWKRGGSLQRSVGCRMCDGMERGSRTFGVRAVRLRSK